MWNEPEKIRRHKNQKKYCYGFMGEHMVNKHWKQF